DRGGACRRASARRRGLLRATKDPGKQSSRHACSPPLRIAHPEERPSGRVSKDEAGSGASWVETRSVSAPFATASLSLGLLGRAALLTMRENFNTRNCDRRTPHKPRSSHGPARVPLR